MALAITPIHLTRAEEAVETTKETTFITDQAVALYDAEDYDNAVPLLQEAADQGDPVAQNKLGNCYTYGWGVEQDYERAVGCYSRAVWLGNLIAMNNLGLCFELGNGVKEDIDIAVYFYEKGANQGNTVAACNLGYLYYYGKKIALDREKAISLYEKSAKQGNGRAMYELGVAYGQGLAVKKDYAKAKEYFKKSKEKGYEKAQSGLDWIEKLEREAKPQAATQSVKKTPTATQSVKKTPTAKGTVNAYTPVKKAAVSPQKDDYYARLEEEQRLKKEQERRERDELKRRQDCFKRFTVDLKKSMGWSYNSNYGERVIDSNCSFSISMWSEEFKVTARAKVEILEQYFYESPRNSVRNYLMKYIEKEVCDQMQRAGFSAPFSIDLSVEFIAR
jgi:TPR repeat protein